MLILEKTKPVKTSKCVVSKFVKLTVLYNRLKI